jgi:plastocyanin
MKLNRSDREVFAIGSLAFAFVAMALAFAALVTAAQSESRSKAADKRVAKLAASGVVGSTAKVTLQEFSMTVHPGLVQSGKVSLQVDNVGSIVHELVIVRAAGVAALPKVTKAGERSVGAIDEEAIAESDKMGETGDVAARSTVTKTFDLPPGTYVMFCNIDSKNGGKVLNHFTHGMVATLLVV